MGNINVSDVNSSIVVSDNVGTLDVSVAETEYTLRINGTTTDEYNGHKIKYIHYNGNDYKIKEVPSGFSV